MNYGYLTGGKFPMFFTANNVIHPGKNGNDYWTINSTQK